VSLIGETEEACCVATLLVCDIIVTPTVCITHFSFYSVHYWMQVSITVLTVITVSEKIIGGVSAIHVTVWPEGQSDA
jgi:hypothetical protein